MGDQSERHAQDQAKGEDLHETTLHAAGSDSALPSGLRAFLCYGANKHKKTAFVDISPHRPTALEVGFVNVSKTPRSPPRQGKGTILYKKKDATGDPIEDIYNKMVMAEKRRLLKTNQRVKKAHFQTSLDRAKAQIIAQKAKESQEKDEMLRRMMQKSDEQLKEHETR